METLSFGFALIFVGKHAVLKRICDKMQNA
jgi:hypothetical protein